MVNQNRVVAWKRLKDQLKQIGDPILRNALFAELKKRAWEEWGYNPETAYVKKQNATVELDDWEKDFVEDIKKAEQYQVDTRENKRQQTNVEFKNRMRDFVVNGGKFSDLPPELQNKTILKAYLDATILEMQDCITFLENN